MWWKEVLKHEKILKTCQITFLMQEIKIAVRKKILLDFKDWESTMLFDVSLFQKKGKICF